jgi:broad specificity phosphatase PhoE
MNTFIFIRHGESMATEYIAGRTPVPLSDKGRKEAKTTASLLSKIKIDHLIASPLQRTKETAGYLSDATGLNIEFMEDFIEVEFGGWTGRTFADLKNDPSWKTWNLFRSAAAVPDGESMLNVQNRMISGIEKLRNKYPDKTIAIVSHGDPIRTVFLYYLAMPIDMVLRIKINTASVSILKLYETTAAVHCYNYTPDLSWLDLETI